jgi:peroxiredoxin Q/BCP
MPERGEPAPDFTIPSTRGPVTLSDLARGRKLLLAFYTEDNTPLCSSEVAMLRDDYDIVKQLGAEVLAVSADPLDSHEQFAERLGGVPFALGSDTGLEAARAYDVVDEAGKRSRRALFVIENGRIVHAERWFQPNNPDQYEAVFRALGFDV